MSQDRVEWKSDGFSEVIDGEGFWQGVKDCIPTLLGYLSIGFAAGVVEKTSGLSMMEVALMSLFTLCWVWTIHSGRDDSCKSSSIGHYFYDFFC